MPFLDYVAIGIFVVVLLIYLLKSKRKKDRYGEYMNYDADDVNDLKNPIILYRKLLAYAVQMKNLDLLMNKVNLKYYLKKKIIKWLRQFLVMKV